MNTPKSLPILKMPKTINVVFMTKRVVGVTSLLRKMLSRLRMTLQSLKAREKLNRLKKNVMSLQRLLMSKLKNRPDMHNSIKTPLMK